MLFETRITNKFSGEIDYPSPVSGFPFKIAEDGFIVHQTTDVYNVLARYEEVIFLPGKEEFKKSTVDSNMSIRKLYPGKLKLKVRKDWQEPQRKFPTCWFLNEGTVPLEVVKPDPFDTNFKLYLFRFLPVLSSVPVYSQFAKYKKYTILPHIYTANQMPGAPPGAMNRLENRELSGERTKQELERLQRMIKDWKEEQKTKIKLM